MEFNRCATPRLVAVALLVVCCFLFLGNKGCCKDEDGDGFYCNCDPYDCNDGDKYVHPNATEVCDGIDNNCDGHVLISDGCIEVIGFGSKATGGLGGKFYAVANLNDSGPGSLREGAESYGAKWIVFAVSGKISLKSPIRVASNKTIDGRGADITITGNGLVIDGVSNVIVENISFIKGSGDAISIISGAHDIWIDHCTFSNWGDGTIDITRQATDITISWCKFFEHDKTMLVSASPDHDEDEVIRVTMHHCYFEQTNQRHPRLRYGKFHAFNNYLFEWGSYGMCSSQLGQLRSENNIFEAGPSRDAIISHCGDDPKSGYVKSTGDWKLNGASISEREPEKVFDPGDYYDYVATEADEALMNYILSHAGGALGTKKF